MLPKPLGPSKWRVLYELARIWHKSRQQRLCQLLVNAIEVGGVYRMHADSSVLFYMDDARLIEHLKGFEKKYLEEVD